MAQERVRIVFADELPGCPDCDEPWCPVHEMHYAECACVGPMNAEDLGYTLEEIDGVLWGVRQRRARSRA